MIPRIAYVGGYKYQLDSPYVVVVGLRPDGPTIETRYLKLRPDGTLTIKEGYAWDGPSGPAIDTKNFLRGSLVHDALYQLMRKRLLDREIWRDDADRELQRICLEDGMSKLRAWWVYQGVRFGGGPSADPDNDNLVRYAP